MNKHERTMLLELEDEAFNDAFTNKLDDLRVISYKKGYWAAFNNILSIFQIHPFDETRKEVYRKNTSRP